MKNLEKIASQAATLSDFLSAPDLIESYFLESQRYYGAKRFPRPAYDLILSQLRSAIGKLPELEKRLWRKIDPRPYSFQLDVERGQARKINPELWDKYLNAWASNLKEEFDGVYDVKKLDEFREKSIKILERAHERITRFENESKQRRENGYGGDLGARFYEPYRKQRFYQQVRHDPELTKIAAFNLYFLLTESDSTRALLHCEDGDVVLNLIRTWRTNPKSTLAIDTLFQHPHTIVSALSDRILNLQDLLENGEIFPRKQVVGKAGQSCFSQAVKAGSYLFEALPRPFHGIWKGIPVDDCLAAPSPLGEPTPARWALAALEGYQAIHVRTSSTYHGSLQLLPMRSSSDPGRTWSVLEFWSPLLLLKPVLKNSDRTLAPTFLDLVVEHLKRNAHAEICACEGEDFDNFSVTCYLIDRLPRTSGKRLGHPRDFTLLDPFAQKICQAFPHPGFKAFAPNQMLHSAAATSDGNQLFEIHLLNEESGDRSEAHLPGPAKV